MGNTPANTKSVPEEPEQGFSSTDSHTEDALIEKSENVVLKADENDTDNYGQKDSGSLDGSGLLPMPPYAGDCPHFIRTGSCNFGLDCRYNHPDKRTQTQAANDLDKDVIPEDSGPIECKYYQTGTAEGCKYGKSCRHGHHGEESQNIVPKLNFLGLPIRLGEKECPLYMRNATCGYGSHCAYNHPDPTPMTGMGSSNSSVDDKFGRQLSHPLEKHNGSPIHFSGASQPDQASRFLYTSSDNTTSYPNSRSPYVTPYTPPQQMQKQSEWNGYQASNSHQSANYSATPSADGSLRKSYITMSDELLERPGHPKCDYFVKTGNRKFWSARRNRHPKDRKPKPDEHVLSEKGLPLSPMNFPFVLSEEDRLHSHISQRSQLKYIKLVLDKFDAGQKQDLQNSCFGYMTELAELQFSAQLMQQLMFRLVDSGKTNELWFNIKGHYTRFGLTEYALVTGLKCSGSINLDEYEKTVQKKRLKERYFQGSERVTCKDLKKVFLQSSTTKEDRFKLGLALIVEGVFIAPDKNVGIDLNTLGLVDNLKLFFEYPWGQLGYQRIINPSKCYWSKKLGNAKSKAKNEKEITYTIHGCPLAMQIWAYEAVPELGESFAKRLGFRTPRILNWTATKQQQQRSYEAFFKDTPLQVYATLRPCIEEKNMEYITTLVPLEDNVVEELDDLALNMELPQCDEEEIGIETHKGSSGEIEEQEMDTENGSIKNEESSRGSSEIVMHEGGKSSEPDSENHAARGHQTKMEIENVGTDAFKSTPMHNKSFPETCLNEPSTSRRALSRDEVMEFLSIQEKNLNEKMDKYNAIIMDRLEVFEKKVDEGFQQVNEFLNSKFERIDNHVCELCVEVRANATTTECYSLLIKKDLQKFVVDQVNDLKECMKMQRSTREPTREGQATEEFQRSGDYFTPAPGLNREST